MEAAKPDLLFLCHRIPFPPDKGDKIRSYRWLRALSRSYRVHLAAFVDDVADWQHRESVEALCATCLLVPLRPERAKIRSLSGLLTGRPLSLPYYGDGRIRSWLKDLRERLAPARVFVYSSAMAQYAAGSDWSGARRVIDFVDVDADKWRQYAQGMCGPLRWLYGREAQRLAAFDQGLARTFDLSIFVSSTEAAYFRASLGGSEGRVTHVTNGVDSRFFDPTLEFAAPYRKGSRVVVFTGAMDYWANVDAVSWFCDQVWPRVRERVRGAAFYIVGSRPARTVEALASEDVVVTGRVPDVRPYLRHASAVVAPMRIARGIQNKVLEGMAMGRPVLVTSKGLEGIEAKEGQEVLVADDAEDFAESLIRVLSDGDAGVGAAARALVCREFAWEASTRRFLQLVEGGAHPGKR